VIYLSGGGAELAHEQVVKACPQTRLVPEVQIAIARAYLYYANFAAREDQFLNGGFTGQTKQVNL
jgi:hypothetical protein